jgi:hypothetical protein
LGVWRGSIERWRWLGLLLVPKMGEWPMSSWSQARWSMELLR